MIIRIALLFACMTALPISAGAQEKSVFGEAIKDSMKIIMTVANPHAKAANEAFGSGDTVAGCSEARLAYDGYTAARQVFRKALVHYETKDATETKAIGYLKENVDSVTRMRLPYELFLTNVCPAITGLPAPADS